VTFAVCDVWQDTVTESTFSQTVPPGLVRLFLSEWQCLEVIGQRVSVSAAEFVVLLW